MQTTTVSQTAYNPSQGVVSSQPMQPAYRAEYNPLSARWMVLSEFDVCVQAGLSKVAAIALAESL